MPGRIYSAHDSVGLTGSGSATYEMYITAPSTNNIRFTDLIVSGDFDAATDDPVLVEFLRVTSPSGGTTLTPSKHYTENSLASGATVKGDGVTATPVSNSVVFAQYVKPSYSFKPGVTIAPSESWAIRMTPGAQSRTMTISAYWEE